MSNIRANLTRRLHARVLERITDGPPSATTSARDISTDVYTDVDRHHDELMAMRQAPWAALPSDELPTSGGVRVVDLSGRSVVLTRDSDGQPHAMDNACAHRGATVVTEERDNARLLSCNFHGWSYNLDGSLRSVSDADMFSTTSCTRGLRTLHCEDRHGIVWVTPAAGCTTSVADWIGCDLDDILSALDLRNMVQHASVDINLECNWKLLTDGFLEIYHLKYLHRDSIAPYFPAHFTLLESHGPHVIGWLPKNRLVRDISANPDTDVDVLGAMTGAVVLVPGTVIQWQAGHAEIFSLRPDPQRPGASRVRMTMLVPRERCHDIALWDRNWERLCATIPAEDFAAAEDVQANIAAGLATTLQLGANESMIAQHLDAVDALISRSLR